jgi:nitrite reductase/ring-hydroxylating ferredoxin subunit
LPPLTLCRLDDLSDGTSRGFDPEGQGQDTVIVVRQSGQVFVYRNACPHLDTPLAWRKDAYLNGAKDYIVCFAHGALFAIETGKCVLGPCMGQYLPTLTFHINKSGFIVLDGTKEISE